MKFFQKMRKLVTLLAAAAILVGLPAFCFLRTSAASPLTYAVKYLPDRGEWRYQSGTSTFDESKNHRELYYLYQELREGDLVVVYNDSTTAPPALKLGNKRLSNLTVTATKSFTIVYSGDVDECYLLGGAFSAINAKVTNAYVYDTVLSNFNRNVTNLFIYPENRPTATIGCGGTVDQLNVVSRTTGEVFYCLYDFRAGSFLMTDGILKTDKSKYSLVPKTSSVRLLTAETFDHIRYASDYPDVKAAVGADAAALYRHYATLGVWEGRIAYPTNMDISSFDHVRYADENPDLRAAFGYDAQALYSHYITKGIAEKRGNYAVSTYNYFDHVRYANDHPDLKAVYGYDAQALYSHYTTKGIEENRGYYISVRTVRQ